MLLEKQHDSTQQCNKYMKGLMYTHLHHQYNHCISKHIYFHKGFIKETNKTHNKRLYIRKYNVKYFIEFFMYYILNLKLEFEFLMSLCKVKKGFFSQKKEFAEN